MASTCSTVSGNSERDAQAAPSISIALDFENDLDLPQRARVAAQGRSRRAYSATADGEG